MDDDGKLSSSFQIASRLKLPELPYGDVLYDHVDSGFLKETRLVNRFNYLIEHAASTVDINSSSKWRQVWSGFSDRFGECENDIEDLIASFLDCDHELLTADSYDTLEVLAATVGMDISSYKSASYIRSFQRVHSSDLFNLRLKYEDQAEFLEIIDKRIESEFNSMSLDDVTRDALNKRSWSEIDTRRIEAETKAGILEWLKTPSDDKVKLVRQGLIMDKSGKIKEVIIELAASSPLNQMRARHLYQIDPSD